MTKQSNLPIGSDMVLALGVLRDRAGNAIIDATVTLESLLDSTDAAVTGIATPANFTHVGGGSYEIALPNNLGVVDGGVYRAKVKAVSGTKQREWTETLNAVIGEA